MTFLAVASVPNERAYCGSNFYLVTLAPGLCDTTFVPVALGGHGPRCLISVPPAVSGWLLRFPSVSFPSSVCVISSSLPFPGGSRSAPALSTSNFACFLTHIIHICRMERTCCSDTTREEPVEIQEEL